MSGDAKALSPPSPSSPPPTSRMEMTDVSNFSVSGKAAIHWELAGAQDRQYLIHPDPKNRFITFEVWATECEASSDVQAKLSSNITSLRFSLHQPAHLIVPSQWTVLHPRRTLSADIIKALESLATSCSLTVYLEHTILSKSRLQALVHVIQSGLSKPVPSYSHLHRLYEGTGGKRYLPVDESTVSTDSEAALSTHGESPPAYNDIGPGPPMPPSTSDGPWVAESVKGPGKRHRHSGSASIDGGESPSNRPTKRGPGGKDSGPAEKSTVEGSDLLQLCQQLFVEFADVKQVASRQEKTIQELQDKVALLEAQARVREDRLNRLQAEVKTQQDDLVVIEQRIDKGDVAVVDLDAAVTQHDDTLAELEHNVAALQEHCEDFALRRVPEMDELRDELRAEVMGRLRSALESP